MKKLTNFIVDKRYYILGVVILLTIFCIFLSNDVKINNDMAKYLPNTSETRIGMDIMEDEFSSLDGTLNILLKDLNDEEKDKAYSYLTKLDNVDKVEFQEKDNLQFYEITTDIKSDSKQARELYNKVKDHFSDSLVDTSGSISSEYKDVLPFYIVVLAVLSALVILIIMCESYIEPFLFLTSILIAVALNNGTNIIFPSVSNITKSISSILQMALSMDYSIMLINRYRQEKENEKDKVKAMKEALYNAFKSISSSSVTTIVGLLALVFMSFTIGRDLGFVLAKGVLFSLLSIFTSLPALILMFDKLITKTAKKSPIVNLNKVGALSYKYRYLILIIFLLIFGGSFLAKGNLGYNFNAPIESEITKNFNVNNQMAIIYPNSKEKEMANYCLMLDGKIDDVLCYGNTINYPLTYDKLNSKLDDLGSDITIDDYLAKIIYYHYYNKDENNKITLAEIINFIKDTVYNNEKMSKDLDEEMKENIDRIQKFSSIDELNKLRTANEIANTLSLDESDVKKILIYYNSKKTNTNLGIDEFINFMNSNVINNKEYNSSIDSNMRNNLNKISKFVSKNTINTKLNKSDMANLFNLDLSTVDNLYTYYLTINEIDSKMSLNEFANFVLDDIVTNSEYNSLISEEDKENLLELKEFSDSELINKKMTAKELSEIFPINEQMMSNIIYLIKIEEESTLTLTIDEFIEYVTFLKNNTNYLNYIDVSSILEILQSEDFRNSVDLEKKYSTLELSTLLNVSKEDINSIYNLIEFTTNDKIYTPYELVNGMLNTEMIKGLLSEDLNKDLNKVNFIMTSTINNKTFTYQEMKENLGISLTLTKNVYSLYFSNGLKLTPYELVNFIINHQNDEMLNGKISKSTIEELKLLKTIMTSILNGTKYSKDGISNLLGIDKESISLVYSLYDDIKLNKNLNVSFKEFVSFVTNDVINNKKYNSNITEDKKNKLNVLTTVINNSLNSKKYNKEELFNTLKPLSSNLDKDLIDLVYIYYGSVNEYDSSWTMTIEEVVEYLNNEILNDKRFDNYTEERKDDIISSKNTINDARELLIGKNYSRVVINSDLEVESDETFDFIKETKNDLDKISDDIYLIGDSPMSYEMSKSFNGELDFITVLTMIFIFVIVAITFKSILIPIILVLIIQTAVFFTMSILSLSDSIYFISILIVQSILMGATIDYAILYTSYYLEERKKNKMKTSLINAYNDSIHTILTSASILIIVTLIVGKFSSEVAAKICLTISEGTFFSAVLILLLLPGLLAVVDKFIGKRNNFIKSK